jgi:subfamily B ATP-binding cassette protein MsbA
MWLLKFLKPYVPQIIGAALCTAFVTAATLLIAPLAGFAFKAIENRNFLLLNLSAAGIVGLYLLKGLFTYGQDYLSYFVSNRVVVDLRDQLYEHLQEFSLDFYNRWHTGELLSRMMNDIAVLQTTLLTGFAAIIPQSLLLVGLIVYVFWLNWRLALLALIALPLLIQVIRMFATEIRNVSESLQQKTADITTHAQETLSNIRVVKAFTMEKEESGKFKAENRKFFNITMRAVQILSTQNPVVAFLQALAVVSIVWYGGMEIIHGNLTLPQLISFATALGIMTDPGSTLSKAFAVLQQGAACSKRVFELMALTPSIVNAKDAQALPGILGRVEFKNLSFAYETEEVLSNVNLAVNAGEAIALVGKTGSGKSTLVSLLLRFYDPTRGEILIDGHNLKSVTIESLRQQIAVVPQEIILFQGSVKENIAYGSPRAKEEEIVAAAKSANAHSFISALAHGYDTEVGERGARLSGGEKQRIAIARAILRNPKILILDEATSSLDPATEALIREALEKLMRGRTTFIIAHRLYTVEKVDRVVVLDKGRVVEVGSHAQLLARPGMYRQLYESQFQNKT